MNKEEIQKQIKVMKDYLRMNLDRDDFHACWDAAIDLQRLQDKSELSDDFMNKYNLKVIKLRLQYLLRNFEMSFQAKDYIQEKILSGCDLEENIK